MNKPYVSYWTRLGDVWEWVDVELRPRLYSYGAMVETWRNAVYGDDYSWDAMRYYQPETRYE